MVKYSQWSIKKTETSQLNMVKVFFLEFHLFFFCVSFYYIFSFFCQIWVSCGFDKKNKIELFFFCSTIFNQQESHFISVLFWILEKESIFFNEIKNFFAMVERLVVSELLRRMAGYLRGVNIMDSQLSRS